MNKKSWTRNIPRKGKPDHGDRAPKAPMLLLSLATIGPAHIVTWPGGGQSVTPRDWMT